MSEVSVVVAEVSSLYATVKAKVAAVLSYVEVHYQQLTAALLIGHYSSLVEKVVALVHKVL
jgi:phosphohistidine phosphatase SixA